jgi:hypothetical protein
MMWGVMYIMIKFRRVRGRQRRELLVWMGRESGIGLHMLGLSTTTHISRMIVAGQAIMSVQKVVQIRDAIKNETSIITTVFGQPA